MKNLLTIFLLLFAGSAFSQSQTSYVVPNIISLKAYSGMANRVYVADQNSDFAICSPCTVDEVTIFAGAAGRKWKEIGKVYEQSVVYPLYAPDSITIAFRNDSLPQLKYAAAGRNVASWQPYTLADKKYVDSVSGGGGGSELWKQNGTKIYTEATNVGINTNNPIGQIHVEKANLGTSVNDSSGIVLSNSTPATAILVQNSPLLTFIADGWKLSGQSQQQRAAIFTVPNVNGATESPDLVFAGSPDSGKNYYRYGTFKLSGSDPYLAVGGSTIGPNTITTTGSIGAPSVYSYLSGASFTKSLSSITSGVSTDIGTNITNHFGGSGGTNTLTGLSINGNIDFIGGTTTIRGIYYKPTLTSLTGVTHIGFENTTGNNLFGTTSGSTSVGATSTIPSSRIFQVVSTTKASSPFPVMTATQKASIASPQVGDHIYQSDGTEGVYVYKSTGWTFAY